MSVPKLRFKEFDGDWSETSIGKLTKYFKGYAFKSESYKESGRRIIRVSDLGRDSIKYDNDAIFLDEVESSNYKDWMLKKDDIVITTVGSKPHLIDSAVGRPIYIKNNEEGLLNQNLLVLRPINQEVEPYFIFSQLLDNKYLTHIETIQRGNANQSNITVKDLQEFKVFSTSKIEQTQIASFLSAVDEKISQLTQKHELLSQYKQGMMQKLFSQQLRFKADDGSDFGEWEEIKLGDIASKVGSGSTPRGGAEAYTEDGIIFIRSQNVNNNQLLLDDVVYIPEQTHKKMSGSKVVANDILLNITGASIGRSCVVPMNFTEANVNQHVCIIRTPNDNPRFIQSFLASKDGQDLIDSHQTGSGREGLNFQSIRSFTLNRPCLEEQTQIANFLSAIDQKIEVVAQQIEQAKLWKKGLLQQMFV